MTALVIGPADGRVAAQLHGLGVAPIEGVRPELHAIARHVRAGDGDLVLLYGDIVTNTEALAGLIEDPRIVNGVLVDRAQHPGAPPLRVRSGMVVSAGSEHHTVSAPDAAFLGVLKVGAAQRALLAEIAERVAPMGDRDALALLTVGLVRAGVPLRAASLRGMVWARPASEAALAAAARVDEDAIRLDSAVKQVDGFFTTFFVTPYSRHIARWAARRGLTPNQVTTMSLGLGILSAACFATGQRWGLVAGAVLLQAAFTADCVDGQLARYTRRFSEFGGWLDAMFDRAKEYLAFAGLAIGAERAGDPVWVLAGAALALQTVRHTIDFSWHYARRTRVEPPVEHAAGAPARVRRLARVPAAIWIRRLAAFPIGERFALISVTAALWSARTTFTAWLAWGAFAASYGLAGRILRSPKLPRVAREHRELCDYRDDGPIARVLAPLGHALEPALLVPVALVPLIAAMAIWGDGAPDGAAVGVVAWLVVAAGLSAGRTGRTRMRWIVPALLRAGEYAGLLWIGTLAGASSIQAAFALVAALAVRHYDLVYGLRFRGAPVSERLGVAMGGWDGRLVLGCLLLILNGLPAGFYVLAAMIAIVFGAAAIHDWSRARMPATFHDDQEDVEA